MAWQSRLKPLPQRLFAPMDNLESTWYLQDAVNLITASIAKDAVITASSLAPRWIMKHSQVRIYPHITLLFVRMNSHLQNRQLRNSGFNGCKWVSFWIGI